MYSDAAGGLMPQIILAEYFCLETVTLLFIAGRDFEKPKVYPIQQPLKEIQEWVRLHFGQGKNVMALDANEYQQRFGEFVAPIGHWAEPGDVVYLAPHDVLHYLPLHALKVEGEYLIDRNPVTYTPSATVIQHCQKRRKTEKRDGALILAYAPESDPLPHTRQQAQVIAARFGTQPLLDAAATKATVDAHLKDDDERERLDVLHFACHGRFEGGLQAYLELADGRLTAQDFFNLQIQADLVTLSACESGVNEQHPGDELIGFTRALIIAGTPSVIVSLWRVDELSTSFLMQAFYDEWNNGRGAPKALALQRAQQKVREMTAGQAIAICQQMISASSDASARTLLAEDIAHLHFKAGDFARARADFERLAHESPSVSAQWRRCQGMIRRIDFVAHCQSSTPDYGRRIFDHLYAWSPFVLVGDWK